MNFQNHLNDKVFAQMTEDPVTIPGMANQFNLSKNVVTNNSESPICNLEYGKNLLDFDFLECGAEEIVETHVEPEISFQESLTAGVVSFDHNEKGEIMFESSGPVQSVRQKFVKLLEAPHCSTFGNKDVGKHLAPREDLPQIAEQTKFALKPNINQKKTCQTEEETFTQKLDVAADMMKGIGIDIRPGGNNGSIGIVHLRSRDEFQSNTEAQLEKLKPVDKFKSNEVVFGTCKALQDLVTYHKDIMVSTAATGVYTDKNYRFLGWSYKTQEEYCDVRLAKILGQGSFGSVELWQAENYKYFVKKKIHQDNFCKNEVLLTLGLQHPNILKMYGFIIHQDYREIIMDYAGESLLSYSMRADRPEKIIWDVTYFALEGLKYLHENNIIHFDVKPENVCIKEGPDGLDVTIADFGSAQKIGENLEPKSMTYEYSAPELCRDYIRKRLPNKKMFVSDVDEDQSITGKVDIFALGLTVMFPYEKSHVMIKKFTGGLDSYATIERPEFVRLRITLAMAANPNLVHDLIPANVGQNMRDVILGLTKGNPKERLDANQAIDLMRDISLKAEAVRQVEEKNKKEVRRSTSRKVKVARRRSSGENTLEKDQKEKCQGVDLSLISQEASAILGENTQLKHRVIRGLLKRKLNENVPSTGKQMRVNSDTENQDFKKIPELEEKVEQLEQPSNLPNLDMMF